MELRPQYCQSLRGGSAANRNESEVYEKGLNKDAFRRRKAPLTLGGRDSLLHINENNNTSHSNRSNTYSFSSSIVDPISKRMLHPQA